MSGPQLRVTFRLAPIKAWSRDPQVVGDWRYPPATRMSGQLRQGRGRAFDKISEKGYLYRYAGIRGGWLVFPATRLNGDHLWLGLLLKIAWNKYRLVSA
jgi:hypothetical protein